MASINSIANECDPDGGIADRLVSILEADPSGDRVLRMKMSGRDVGDAVRQLGAYIDAADPQRDSDSVHVSKRHRRRFGEIAVHALADERNASRMLASLAAVSTTMGNSPMGSIARSFGAS